MKTMKRFASRLCAVLLVLTVGVTALVPAAFAAKAQLPSLPSDQCVVDDANVLSDSTTTTIENLNAQLTEQCSGAQIGVLTVEYTGSVSTEDYAVQAANAWGLGSSSNNNGVLILLVMQSQQYADGDYYLATGDGFRNTTLEKQASAIAQTMEDSFAAGDYDAAVTTCVQNVASTIADIYGVTLSGTTGSTGTVGNGNTGSYKDPYYDAPAASYQSPFVTLLSVLVILGTQIDIDIGVCLVQGLNAFRSSDQADELDPLCAVLLDLADGVDGAAAGGQHRVQDQDVALGDILGQLAEVLHRLQGGLVAVQADEADLCGGQQGQHTVQHTHACAQDGHQSQLAASQNLGLCHGDGRLDLDLFQRQVTGGFVAQQGRDLANEVTELLGAGLLVAKQADLVLQQGMLNDHRGHNKRSFFIG